MEPTPDEAGGGPGSRKGRRTRPTIPIPDAGNWIGDQRFKIESRESRPEIAARLNSERVQLDHDLRKDFALFLGVMAIVIAATLTCLFIVLSNRYPPTIQNSAMALLAVIVSGGVGYVTGKSSKKT